MTDLTFAYQKLRKDFGKQCGFSDKKFLMVSIPSDHDEFNNYILRNPIEEGTQLNLSKQYALTEVNTMSTTTENKGIMFTEGGWPKDVNFEDSEQTLRYRRKLEKEDSYLTQVPRMGERVEFSILQNNAVNIYEEYFEGLEPAPIVDRCQSRTMFVYKDVETPSRPVNHLSWSPDGGFKLAITYSNTEFQKKISNLSLNSYIWETENSNRPLYTLSPSSPSICIEYHQKDVNLLVSGQSNGQCCAWDTRAGSRPTGTTPREVSHTESVSSVLWINSKTGTEFFSGGGDGQVIWWDSRKLTERLDELYMDPVKAEEPVLERSYGISVLEYETTIPTRFMVGSEQGMLFFCNRKGKNTMEKIPLRMQCHASPIYTLARNPSFFKNFLTVGDWNARIWSEDCKESSIIWTKYCSVELTDGCWSPTKCSLFYLSRTDGNLEAWDLLQQQSEPILTIKISDYSLKCLKAHESGRMIACGSANGYVHLMEVSENMTISAKNDKVILSTMLDRESQREKILEGKSREIKMKLRKQQEQQASKAAEAQLRLAEKAAAESGEKLVEKSLDGTKPIKPIAAAKAKPPLDQNRDQLLIQTAEMEFNQMIDEELQRRVKEQEIHDHPEKLKKTKSHKKKEEVSEVTHEIESEENISENRVVNGTNGKHDEPPGEPQSNGENHENGNK